MQIWHGHAIFTSHWVQKVCWIHPVALLTSRLIYMCNYLNVSWPNSVWFLHVRTCNRCESQHCIFIANWQMHKDCVSAKYANSPFHASHKMKTVKVLFTAIFLLGFGVFLFGFGLGFFFFWGGVQENTSLPFLCATSFLVCFFAQISSCIMGMNFQPQLQLSAKESLQWRVLHYTHIELVGSVTMPETLWMFTSVCIYMHRKQNQNPSYHRFVFFWWHKG